MRNRSLAPARTVPESVLDAVSLSVAPTGVVLGHDTTGAAVLLRLFGPEPTAVVFIGGWWAAQMVVHRCLGYGASVVVNAYDARPAGGIVNGPALGGHGTLAGLAQWLSLGRLAGGHHVRPALGEPVPPSPNRPLLYVHDVGPGGASAPAPARALQAGLTVLARVTPESQRPIVEAAVVLTQRLEPREAAMLGSARRLPPELIAPLETMDHESLAVCRDQTVRYARLRPTIVERQAFG